MRFPQNVERSMMHAIRTRPLPLYAKGAGTETTCDIRMYIYYYLCKMFGKQILTTFPPSGIDNLNLNFRVLDILQLIYEEEKK